MSLNTYSAETGLLTDEIYSPPVRNQPDKFVYWGDTHVHTNLSGDAFSLGNESLSTEDAFRFASGEEVTSSSGQRVKLQRPLDFLAVSDHAEYLGVFALAKAESPALKQWSIGKRLIDVISNGNNNELLQEFAKVTLGGKPESRMPDELLSSIWEQVAKTSDAFNQPGKFTAFSAYEWTAMVTGDNLHRVVLFKDSAETVTGKLPLSALASPDPESLWSYLEAYEKSTGGEVLAIPHNGNLSNGRMFSPIRLNGTEIDAEYARKRARWEPVVEVTQMKGDSETHPYLSPDDPFANFERWWDKTNVGFTRPKEPWMLKYEYARSALREGLRHQNGVGSNPFKFGMIGSTDSHTSLSTTGEDNYFGKYAEGEPGPGRAEMITGGHYGNVWWLGASGLAAVWAEQNSRESLFESIKRREVYATTGTRITLRFFGGWYFEDDDISRSNYAQIGYEKGVPMGGDLVAPDPGQELQSPRFLVMALKDPDGANLDRVQIVKGWSKGGETYEKIYDVALSDERIIDPLTQEAPVVGSTVDLKRARYTNSIGAVQLMAVWEDPEFNAEDSAFYYVRVLEIPTPRWTAYDSVFYNQPKKAGVPMVIQERAYSSPIWYKPPE
ncbi:DUF3604 domain-containing protein [Parahaliea maris]|uniref:DUF3604 domain-containing protein n=2 Tax=Parahaliea maris TaxID=2716870 RepID=A0A5C9A9M2_9GAMM|nr:DUF3604 domain-containing protein [Parahaliea maris]